MNTTPTICARLSALLFVLLFSSFALAGTPKVEVCHAPPGNIDNFHTIKIKESALAAHLAHGDLAGACNALCAQICDDGDACTVDDTGDCEENGCPVVSEPVDCSDMNLCTDDVCDSVSGCSNPVAITCEAPDLCTSSTCDPLEGVCEDIPVVCNEGEACNPSNGQCESVTPEPTCPCFDEADLQALGTVSGACGDDTPHNGIASARFENGSAVCSGFYCADATPLSCLIFDGVSDILITEDPITIEQDIACRSLIVTNCPAASSTFEASAASVSAEPSVFLPSQ